MRIRRSCLTGMLLGGLLTVWVAPDLGSADPPDAQEDGHRPNHKVLKAEISRTTGGTPHVRGKSYTEVGYGLGYTFAEDHSCTMAPRWITVNAEAAATFGPDGGEFPHDARPGNLASDLYFQRLIDEDFVGDMLEDKGPTGVLREVRALVHGYTIGYNQYLEEVDFEIPDPRCEGATWIRPITERDVYLQATFWADMVTAVRSEFAGFAAAVPPGSTSDRTLSTFLASELDNPAPAGITASNMIALGSEGSRSGRGMVFSNPHWEWGTADSMLAAHLTIPGKLNVNGMTFGASPVIGIGHNDKVGWGATSAGAQVRNGVRYRLDLVDGSPTTYLVDGQPHEMVPTTVTVQVRNEQGDLEPVQHTFYDTLFGTVSVGPGRPWTEAHAYTLKHSPLNLASLNMWHLYSQARTVDDIHDADRATMGVAWINTVAADSRGQAYRSVPTPLPYVTDTMLLACDVGAGVLDGSRTDCVHVRIPPRPTRECSPPDQMPFQFRRDYVMNSNDSHWLSNLREPLEGYPLMFGAERTQQRVRTRTGLQMIEERLNGTDGLPGRKFTLDQFIDVTFDGRHFLGLLWQDELVAFCEELTADPAAPAQLPQACAVLDTWRGTNELDDPGAVLFRRFGELSGFDDARFTVPFDPADPVGTPRGLNETVEVRDALFGAVNDLVTNGIPLDATFRDYQYRLVGDERIPLRGGGGIYKALGTTAFEGADGWQAINGSGFVYWVELTRRAGQSASRPRSKASPRTRTRRSMRRRPASSATACTQTSSSPRSRSPPTRS